jgi:hypothetical protein
MLGARDVVQHNRIGAFGLQLFTCAADVGVHLGGEGDHQRAGTMRLSDRAQNVFGGLKVEVQRAFAAQLAGSDCGHAEVGDRGSSDDDRRGGQMLHHRNAHLFGRGDGHKSAVRGRRERSRRRDENDLRAAPFRGLGDRVAHLAAGAVAEKADWVDRLARAAGGDENGFAGEVLCRRGLRGGERGENGFGDGFDAGEASRASHSAGEIAAIGIYKNNTALAQQGDVGASSRVVPHIHVHRRRDDDRRGGDEEHGRQKVVGEAVRHLGQHVRGGRSDDDSIGGLRTGDVLDLILIVETCGRIAFPHAGDHFVSGERGERERADKLLRSPGHDDVDVDFVLLQETDEFSGLVSGDSAANSDVDAISRRDVLAGLAASSAASIVTAFGEQPQTSAAGKAGVPVRRGAQSRRRCTTQLFRCECAPDAVGP